MALAARLLPTVDSHNPDDTALLLAWRQGSAPAGSELLKRHFVAVYRFFAANVSDPDEYTQQTFEACVRQREAVHTDFRGYLFGIARNVLNSEWRRRHKTKGTVPPSQAEIRDVRTSPSAAVARLDQQRLVLAMIAQLPVDYRAVVEMYYWEDQPLAAIAQRLGVPLGTVKSRLFRGKALLKDQLTSSGAPLSLQDVVLARLRGSR